MSGIYLLFLIFWIFSKCIVQTYLSLMLRDTPAFQELHWHHMTVTLTINTDSLKPSYLKILKMSITKILKTKDTKYK